MTMWLQKISALLLLLFLTTSGSQKVNGEAPPAGEPSIIKDLYISIKESIFGVVEPALPPPKYIYSLFWDCWKNKIGIPVQTAVRPAADTTPSRIIFEWLDENIFGVTPPPMESPCSVFITRLKHKFPWVTPEEAPEAPQARLRRRMNRILQEIHERLTPYTFGEPIESLWARILAFEICVIAMFINELIVKSLCRSIWRCIFKKRKNRRRTR